MCAHGRHDQCCAVRGRVVAARLAAAYPEETWECSHLGGDRFAGTMVLLPHGLYYGWVDDGDAVAVVDAYLAGRVDPAVPARPQRVLPPGPGRAALRSGGAR